jgi:hypothetical protein
VYRLADYVRRLGGDAGDAALARYPFLGAYLEQMAPLLPRGLAWADARDWWRREIEAWERGAARLPLVALSAEGGLDHEARMALITTGLADEDPRLGRVIAEAQGTPGVRRPCLDTLAALSADPDADAWSVSGGLLETGVAEVADPGVPRSEWVLRVAPALWEVVRGQARPCLPAWCRHTDASGAPGLDDLILPIALATRLAGLPALLESPGAGTLILRGPAGSDRRAVAEALAGRLGKGALHVDAERVPDGAWRGVGSLCTALGAAPVVMYDLAPGETADVPRLAGYAGPLLIVLGREGGLRGQRVERPLTVEIPPTPAHVRRLHWERALDGRAADLDALGERLQLPPAHIRRAAAVAASIAALERRAPITLGDVQEACRSLNRQTLDTLAARIESSGDWDRLVVSDMTGARLHELERRCRHRERVLDRLAPAFLPGTNRGVRALMTGASGTGKTLSATILAARLGMDLYRVDLAATVSKYVGETEKNLHRVLSTAEELDVILLIDEGDSLLGSRTEVKSANDRFANLETNYLLQRLEAYRGIVVVTTNAADSIDPAFQRRMDVVVDFVEPGPLERWSIWQLHLPDGHRVAPELLRDVSDRCAMNGGQIRNAALQATLLALDDGGTVEDVHVGRAIAAEYGKAGALSPFDPGGTTHDDEGGIQVFLEALS